MNSIPSPQTVLVMHDKLTIPMLPACEKNTDYFDSLDFLTWCRKLNYSECVENYSECVENYS